MKTSYAQEFVEKRQSEAGKANRNLQHDGSKNLDNNQLSAYNKKRNPITGVSDKQAQMDLHTTNNKEYKRQPIETNDWSKENKAKFGADHITELIDRQSGINRYTTEYKDSTMTAGKEIIIAAGAGRMVKPTPEKMEGKTLYSNDYTPNIGRKGYVDPSIEYQDNKKIVRSGLAANNLGIGGGRLPVNKDSTTYNDTFTKQTASARPEDQRHLS